MSNVSILTDSNSGITQQEAEKLGIYVIPMPFVIDEKDYLEDLSLTRHDFFTQLNAGANVKTSQPIPGMVIEYWDKILKTSDEIVYIPMSSGLSSAYQTGLMLAQDYNGRVQVVNNHRISCTLKQSVLEALYLSKQGWNALKIKEYLEHYAYEASIYIAVDTLEHLKKGGRITSAGAAIGSALHIKPILQIQGEKLDAYGISRSMKQAEKKMIQAVQKDMETRFKDSSVIIKGAYTCDEETALKWQEILSVSFPNHTISLDPLALNIGCHIGEGAIAVVCMKVLPGLENIQYEI